VERALLRTLGAGSSGFSIFSQLPGEELKTSFTRDAGKELGW